jgi:hypothetical protein
MSPDDKNKFPFPLSYHQVIPSHAINAFACIPLLGISYSSSFHRQDDYSTKDNQVMDANVLVHLGGFILVVAGYDRPIIL